MLRAFDGRNSPLGELVEDRRLDVQSGAEERQHGVVHERLRPLLPYPLADPPDKDAALS